MYILIVHYVIKFNLSPAVTSIVTCNAPEKNMITGVRTKTGGRKTNFRSEKKNRMGENESV